MAQMVHENKEFLLRKTPLFASLTGAEMRGLCARVSKRRAAALPKELETLLAWISCIGDAQPIENYASQLCSAGLDARVVENHNAALVELVHQIRMKLLSAEVLVGLKKLALPNVDFTSAKQMAVSALAAVDRGEFGYAVLIAAKPAFPPAPFSIDK